MERGFSLLLREFVAADEVDYGDCADFQIVCPACREAIFKSGKIGQERQFLSHYAASKSDVADCELRVAALVRETMDAENSVSRNQSMALFFQNFRDFVLHWMLEPDGVALLRKRINWMIARPSFMSFAAYWQRSVRDLWARPAERDRIKDGVIGEFADARSRFWIDQQMAFAEDFISHLLAPNSTPAVAFILAVCLHLSRDVPPAVMKSFQSASDAKLAREIAAWRRTKNWNLLGILLLRQMGLLLLLLPYVDMLRGDVDQLKSHSYDLENRELLIKTAFPPSSSSPR